MQTSEIVPQAAVLPFHSGHDRFSHQMVTTVNQAGVDGVSIRDVEKTLPASDAVPQPIKGLKGTVPDDKLQDARCFRVDNCPQPNFF